MNQSIQGGTRSRVVCRMPRTGCTIMSTFIRQTSTTRIRQYKIKAITAQKHYDSHAACSNNMTIAAAMTFTFYRSPCRPTTNPQEIEIMELEGYSRPTCNKFRASSHDALDRRRYNLQARPSTSFVNHTNDLQQRPEFGAKSQREV